MTGGSGSVTGLVLGPLPNQVTSVIAGPCRFPGGMSDPPATMGSGR